MFRTTPEDLIRIIDDWGKLAEQNKKKIIIINDNEKILLEYYEKKHSYLNAEKYIFIPCFFVITVKMSSESNYKNKVADLVFNYLQKKLCEKIGDVKLEGFWIYDEDECAYCVKYKKNVTIENIAKLLSGFEWKFEKRDNFEYFFWDKIDGGPIFVDEKVESVMIFTQ